MLPVRRHTGGCQCGAVRFRVSGELGRASLCHCRMCQKAFAAPFGALVTVQTADLAWTKAEPSRFQSSNKVRRGFCAACGTPLTFEWSAGAIDLAVYAFDHPERIPITVQLATDAAQPWVGHIADLPVRPPAGGADQGAVISYQHPDHET